MDSESYNLKPLFVNIFNKYGSNKLLSSLNYSYLLLDDIDIKLISIPYIININKIDDFNNIIGLSITLSILSLNILYDLPHMLNNTMRNNKPSLHNIFGETISQLASFCLYIESTNVIIDSSNLNNKKK